MTGSSGGRENHGVSGHPEGITPNFEPENLANRGKPDEEDFSTATEDPALSLKENDAD